MAVDTYSRFPAADAGAIGRSASGSGPSWETVHGDLPVSTIPAEWAIWLLNFAENTSSQSRPELFERLGGIVFMATIDLQNGALRFGRPISLVGGTHDFVQSYASTSAFIDPSEFNVTTANLTPPADPPPLVRPQRSLLPFVLYMLAVVVAVCAVVFSSMAFSALIVVPAMAGIYLQQKDYNKRMRAIGEAVVAEAKYIRARYSFEEYSPYLIRARRSLIQHGVDDLLSQLPRR
jgi:hypothetical protein